MPSIDEKSEPVGELIHEDPGKAADLIKKFSTPKAADSAPKERLTIGKFSEDRTAFLNKKSLDAPAFPTLPDRGSKPGGGDKAWTLKLEEQERARKEQNNSAKWKDDKLNQMQQELDKASAECAERSRALFILMEKYQNLSNQYSEVQELLGIANVARIKVANQEKSAIKRELESEQERASREEAEKEAFKIQAAELKVKLNDLMTAESRRIKLEEQFEKIKSELISKQEEFDTTRTELERLTTTIQDLTARSEKNTEMMMVKQTRLTKELEDLDKVLKQSQIDLQGRDEAMDKLSEEHRIEVNKIRHELADATESLDRIKALMHSKDSEIDTLSAKYGSLSEDVAKLKQELALRESENRDFKEEVSTLKKSLSVKEAEVDELSKLYSDSKVDHEQFNSSRLSLERLEETLAQAREKTSLMEEELRNRTVELESLNLEVADLRSNASRLENELAQQKSNCSEQCAQIKDLTDIRASLSEHNEDLENQIEKLTRELDHQGTSKKDYDEKIQQLITERNHLILEMSLKEETLMAVKDECSLLKLQVEKEEQRVIEHENQINSLRSEAAKIQAEIESYRDDVQLAETEHRHLKSEFEGLQSRFDQLSKTHSESLLELEQLSQQNKSLTDDMVRNKESFTIALNEQIEESTTILRELEAARKECILEKELLDKQSKCTIDAENKNLDLLNEIEHLKTDAQNLNCSLMQEREAYSELKAKYTECISERDAALEFKSTSEVHIQELEDQIREVEVAVKKLKTDHAQEIDSIRNRHIKEVENAVVDAFDELSKALRDSCVREVLDPVEINVLTLDNSAVHQFPATDSGDTLPPPVSGIDDMVSTNRGPSLQSYVETLNAYQSQLVRREEKLDSRLKKVKEFEDLLKKREEDVNSRITKVKVKESQIFAVVRSLKERENELKSATRSFERFADRLSNSCMDQETGQFMNKTLSRPSTEENEEFVGEKKAFQKNADDSSPTYLSQFGGSMDFSDYK